MRLFLLFFFLIYSAVHVYAFLKAKAALAFGVRTGLGIAIFMAVMVAAPVIVRFSEKAGYESFAKVMAYAGYLWLGVLFLFFSSSLAVDLYRLVVYVGGIMLQKDLSRLSLSTRWAFYLPLLFSLTAATYGYFEAKAIRVENVAIKTSKLPASIERLRIVQISDVHLGLIVRERRLKKILEKVKEAGPDIFISTGDLVDGQVNKLNGLSDLLKEIRPRFGKYAITGNHEFYAGFEQSKLFTEEAGFRLLRAEAVDVADIITIAGVDDPTADAFGLSKGLTEKAVLSPLDPEKFILFLKHRPLLDKGSADLFDLQVSGHVHKGQIFPFTVVTWLYYPVLSGLASVSADSLLYVSRGSGTWGPPIRFLAPPEVTVIDLIRKVDSPSSRIKMPVLHQPKNQMVCKSRKKG